MTMSQAASCDENQRAIECLKRPVPFKDPIHQLLSRWTLGQYLRTRPPSHVVCLEHNMTVAQAMNHLQQFSVLSAPVFSDGLFVGFVDVLDLLNAVLRVVDVATLDVNTRIERLVQASAVVQATPLSSIRTRNDGFLVNKSDHSHLTLDKVIRDGFLRPREKHAHRLAVYEFEDDMVMDEDDEAFVGFRTGNRLASREIRVTNIISQSDILRFLHRHAEQLAHVFSCPIKKLGLACKDVMCVPCNMPTINAFAAMCACNVYGVGVVSPVHGGMLVGSLSASNLRGLRPENFHILDNLVEDYLAEGQSTAQEQHASHVLRHRTAVGNQAAVPQKAVRGPAPAHCTESATLGQVVEKLVVQRTHRVYVVDACMRPVSILTATDILRCLLSFPSADTAPDCTTTRF